MSVLGYRARRAVSSTPKSTPGLNFGPKYNKKPAQSERFCTSVSPTTIGLLYVKLYQISFNYIDFDVILINSTKLFRMSYYLFNRIFSPKNELGSPFYFLIFVGLYLGPKLRTGVDFGVILHFSTSSIS